MAIERYETSELLGVLRNYASEDVTFWLDRYFGRSHFSNSEWIDFDEIDTNRRLAPFVVPNVQGQPMRMSGFETRRFKPAYLKPKHSLDETHVFRRLPGESLGGTMSPAERDVAIVNDVLLSQADMIRRRWNWMACEALKNGSLTVSGENYPTRTILFGRNSANTVTLSGTAVWGGADADVFGDIRSWNQLIYNSGSAGRDLILTPSASALFFDDEKVQDALNTRRGSNTTLESYNVSGSPVVYHGQLEGGLNVFTYIGTYDNNAGVAVPYLTDGDVLLLGDPGGVRAYGAIMDRKAGFQSLAMFPKMWENEDPSALYLMTQSAPLMIPTNPNATVRARVVSS